MPDHYDIFASYAHDDDEQGHIVTFIEQLKAAHTTEFPGSKLHIFFDKPEIHTGHDWENRIANGLRRSRLFLAFTSPAYYASEYCRREWQEWIDQEIATQILSEGAFPIYTLALPSLNPGTTPEQHARYLADLADAIRQRADTLTEAGRCEKRRHCARAFPRADYARPRRLHPGHQSRRDTVLVRRW